MDRVYNMFNYVLWVVGYYMHVLYFVVGFIVGPKVPSFKFEVMAGELATFRLLFVVISTSSFL